MSDILDRLRHLSPEGFAAKIEEAIVGHLDDDTQVQASPPSPASAMDVIARGDGCLRLYHVRQHDADDAVGAPAVRELIELRDRRGAESATLLTTGNVSAKAQEKAEVADVSVYAGEDVATFVREGGVTVAPVKAERRADVRELAERFAGYWPEQLRVRANAIVDGVDELGEFEHCVVRAGASTELEFRSAESDHPLVKVQFTQTSLLVLVWNGTDFDHVVALTVHRERLPDIDSLLSRIRAALDAVDDRRRS